MMTEPRFSTMWNREPEFWRRQGKVITGPSRTVPDQSLSIAQIFQRFAQGKPVRGYAGQYDEQEDGTIDMEAALVPLNDDFVDRADRYDAKKAELDEVNKRIAKDKADKAEARRKAELDAAVAAELEKRSASNPPTAAGGSV